MECYTYLRNVTDLISDGKTPYERRFGQPLKGPIIPFGSLVENHPITSKDQSRIHQLGKKVLPGLFLGYAGGIWKGDVLIADLEELETMDASEIYSKNVEELYPAPHIHEQMTTSNYGYDIAYNFTHNNIMLEHNAMNNMNNITHMDAHNTQY